MAENDKPKHLSPNALTTADIATQRYTTYFTEVAEDVEYEDVFNPSYWMHHVGTRLKVFDIVRLVHVRGTFDIDVTVRSIVAGGVVVQFRSGLPPEGVNPYEVSAEAVKEAMRVKVCPIDRNTGKPIIYIQHTPRTRWRVIGLNGVEVVRDLTTKEQAETRMALYLNEVRLRLPTDAELLAAAKAVGDTANKSPEKPAERPAA